MVRKTLTLVGALLALFHIWILGSQMWQGQLVDVALVSRWLIAGGLLVALGSLKRRGGSMFWGRQAVAIWLLAALLHGPAIARDLDVATPALPEVTATLAQAVAGVVGFGTLLLLSLFGLRRRAARPRWHLSVIDVPVGASLLSAGSFLLLAPRPPPAYLN